MRLTFGISFIIFVLVCEQISGRSLDTANNYIAREKPSNRPLVLRLHGDQDKSTKDGYQKKNSMSQVSKLHFASTDDDKTTTHSPLKSNFMRFGKR